MSEEPSPSSLAVPGREPDYRGKVRDIYDLGDQLLLVATDRISAFDVVLPDAVPEKGAILTSITSFWFDQFGDQFENHRISTQIEDLPEPFATAAANWGPRFMLVKKLEMLPVECVVRGYLAGSGWKEYVEQGSVSGVPLPEGLVNYAELPQPIFTPSTKAAEGHDENISMAEAAQLVGDDMIQQLEQLSLGIYSAGRDYALRRGILLADTKFEFGLHEGKPVPVLADEVLTPDSSRFWPADEYHPGKAPSSFDKQYVRDHLAQLSWDRNPPGPALPEAVIAGTTERYREIYRLLTGQVWKSQSR